MLWSSVHDYGLCIQKVDFDVNFCYRYLSMMLRQESMDFLRTISSTNYVFIRMRCSKYVTQMRISSYAMPRRVLIRGWFTHHHKSSYKMKRRNSQNSSSSSAAFDIPFLKSIAHTTVLCIAFSPERNTTTQRPSSTWLTIASGSDKCTPSITRR